MMRVGHRCFGGGSPRARRSSAWRCRPAPSFRHRSTASRAWRRARSRSVFAPDSRVHDGSFSNNGWLQELPDPVTKLTWDNAALVSPETAKRLGAATGDVVRLTHDSVAPNPGARRAGPARRCRPRCTSDSGARAPEKVASGIGTNAYLLWPGTASSTSPASRSNARRMRRQHELRDHAGTLVDGRTRSGEERDARAVSRGVVERRPCRRASRSRSTIRQQRLDEPARSGR